MNFSGSMSCSNLRDLRTIQPSSIYDDYDYPPCDAYPLPPPPPCPPPMTTERIFMSPEQAIAENYYDVPRPITAKRRSHSVSNVWKIHLQESYEGASSGQTSPVGITSHQHQSMSAPASPALLGGARQVEEFGVMSVRDRSIYHSLGNSSSKAGKPSFAQLGLMRDIRKIGTMSKTGPTPSWISKWKRRVFILKDNFLFYFDPIDKPIASAPVLGGVYIKDSIIERISLPFTKKVLRITPPVARREGLSKGNEKRTFYIKFKTEDGRNEWYEALMSISLGHRQDPLALLS